MTIDEFRTTLTATMPPDLAPALQALWYDARGEWDQAHQVVQELAGPSGAWVHAYLHRKEGDTGNARYWYRRAARPEATDALEAEWERITSALLAGECPV